MPVSLSFHKLVKIQKIANNLLRKCLFLGIFIALLVGNYFVIRWLYQMNWTGLGEDISEPSVLLKRDSNGEITDVTVKIPIAEKSFWDWLNLIIVPAVLLIVGYSFQQQQQMKAANEIKEDALQAYFDSLSVLLVDKNLLALAAKVYLNAIEDETLNEERELLYAATNVIRARTLSILRKFKDEPELRKSVLLFLIDSEIISKLRVDLSGADCSRIELCNIALKKANLKDSSFIGAKIYNCDLADSNFSGSDFSGAEIGFVNFSGAKLGGADFSGVKASSVSFENVDFIRDEVLIAGPRIGEEISFIDAKLSYIDFSNLDLSGIDFSGANLEGANFEEAKLWSAYFNNANLKKANLSRANLNNVSFFRCNLREANLSGASVHQASFTFANLSKTLLSGVDFADISFTRRQLKQTKPNVSKDGFAELRNAQNFNIESEMKETIEDSDSK
ncbi:MAG: pentapeptide repeat-containing protein [Nodosilinea sp.]